MEIKLGSSESPEFLRLIPLEREDVLRPTLGFRVTVQSPFFSADFHPIWFDKSAIQEFARQGQLLLQRGSGKIALFGVNPGEFELSLESLGVRGEWLARLTLARHRSIEERIVTDLMTTGFKLTAPIVADFLAPWRTIAPTQLA